MAKDAQKTPKKRGMVHWYNPILLARTGIHKVIAGVFGRYADARNLQPALDPLPPDHTQVRYNYSDRDEIWIDYVADLGDGWESTHAVASQLAEPQLDLNGFKGLKRGEILVMGGDQVYPEASRQAYKERMMAPYHAASSDVDDEPDLYAIPGNHDWFDSLTSFMGIFARRRFSHPPRKGRNVGAWRAQQTRSYFAIRLPHGWWLWGVDIQLNDYIDRGQLDYFESVDLDEGDRVILCTAKPSWVYATRIETEAYRNLNYVAGLIDGKRAQIAAILTGDLHHYSRYEPSGEGPHLITAGGGGAFLHPTHKLPKKVALEYPTGQTRSFDLGKIQSTDSAPSTNAPTGGESYYPDKKTSRGLTWKNLGFLILNPDFALAMGAIYALMVWALTTTPSGRSSSTLADWIIGEASTPTDLWGLIRSVAAALEQHPFLSVVVVVIIFGLVSFCDSRKRWKRVLLGGVHSMVHFVAVLAIVWVMVRINQAWFGIDAHEPFGSLMLTLETLVAGGIVGSIVMGLYLLISINVFGLHWNAAYSSLRIADYKNFLRIHLSDKGLTIYPIKIEKVANPKPELIESPMKLT